ncbi:MAG: ATP-binding protein [Thermoflexia bacterium]|nr:MAG: ATP-binding protein [Thermoflexia bacterium]
MNGERERAATPPSATDVSAAKGRGGSPVPLLDLAPKLRRPLQAWNPLDYLRLLYWAFFFPQALRWYVETFADPKYRRATSHDLLPALREDPAQRNLALMGLLLTLVVAPLLAAGMQWSGVPVDWSGVAIGVAFGITAGLIIFRIPDYLAVALPTARAWFRRGGSLHHVTPLPLPGVQRRLEAWLEADRAAGVHNVNQILAYTFQFIPAVRAVNRVLERMPEESLLPAVAELARAPYDWDLVRFGSASLSNALWREAIDDFIFIPERLRHRWQGHFPDDPSLDTPARAVCAGFWYLHEKRPEEASRAFAAVRHLPYGEERFAIAEALAAATKAEGVQGVAAWAERGASLSRYREMGSSLRPRTLVALEQLTQAAGEVRTALRAMSPLLRSTAIGRAVGTLTRLMETAGETCEPPEAELVREVAARWREVLARWGGEVGEEVLLRPVENPFAEGAGGRPVRKTFVGRGEVLAQLERWWAGPPDTPLPVLVLYGHRRMGKSSVLLQLREKSPPHILVAPVDMQDLVTADHTGQLLQRFAGAIHGAARRAGLDPGLPPADGDYATFGQVSAALNGLLKHLDPQMAGRRMVLTVDEYELAEEKMKAGKFDPDFLRYLRAALERHLWLNLILAGRQRLEEELRHYHAVFYGSVEPVKVSFLGRDEAVSLIRRPTDDFALDMEEHLAEEIYRLTGGQPYLIQRLCYELVERWNERFRREGRETPRRVTLEDLRAMLTSEFFRAFFLNADYYFSGVWEEVGPDGQCVLRAFAAQARIPSEALPRDALIRAAGLNPEAGEAALSTLLVHDLLVEEGDSLRLAVPLLYHWIVSWA